MPSLIRYVILTLIGSIGLVAAQAPRWGFLGEDEGLEQTYRDAMSVVFVCVFATELRDVRPPFAKVVYHATVIESYKGELQIGEKIQICFYTDSLPLDEAKRQEFVENANKKNKGSLKFAFLHGGKEGSYSCEFMDVPKYTVEMREFLEQLRVQ